MADQDGTERNQGLTLEEYLAILQDGTHTKRLKSTLEYIFGLNDLLVSKRIISQEQKEKLNSLTVRTETITELLKILYELADLKKYAAVMISLRKTLQEHVEKYFKNGFIDTADSVRLLTDQERDHLCRLRVCFVDSVAPAVTDILDHMLAENYISVDHKDSLDVVIASRAKARKLLDIVECRSFAHYRGFVSCVGIHNLMFKPDDSVMEPATACIAVDSKLEKPSLEKRILEAYKKIPYETFTEIIEGAITRVEAEEEDQYNRSEGETKIIAMAPGCIRSYFSCSSLTSFGNIRARDQKGHLKSFLEKLFSELIGEAVIVRCVFLVDICFQEFSLQCAMNFVDVTDKNSTHELLRNGRENMTKVFLKNPIKKAKERILFCAYMWRYASARKVSSRPAREAYSHLSNVCGNWRTIANRLVFKTSVQNKIKQPDGRIELKREDAIQFQDRVICATQLNDAIYVVTSRETNALLQYSAKFRVYQDKFIVAENIQISSMEASETEYGIFCIDETDGAVWLWTKGQQQGKATVMKQFSPTRCITVSPEDHMRILLLATTNILEIHDQHSKIIQTLQLPDHIERPLWLVRNKGGYILVSHGSNTGNRHRICMINRHGSVVLTYGCKRGNGPEELNRPCCMALDQEDRVFVADTSNHRVVVLDNKMNLINVVLDEKNDGINSPSSLHYVRDSKQLLVTRENFVDIYKVKVIDGSSSDVPKV